MKLMDNSDIERVLSCFKHSFSPHLYFLAISFASFFRNLWWCSWVPMFSADPRGHCFSSSDTYSTTPCSFSLPQGQSLWPLWHTSLCFWQLSLGRPWWVIYRSLSVTCLNIHSHTVASHCFWFNPWPQLQNMSSPSSSLFLELPIPQQFPHPSFLFPQNISSEHTWLSRKGHCY